jgi:site-specific recombinase XerD
LTADDVEAAPLALIRVGIERVPAAIAAAGAHTSERFIEFFTANIRNRNTRMAYALAVRQYFDWCEQRGLRLDAIRPTTVAAYIEQLGAGMASPSVKQHLAAVRQLFDYLVTGGILPSNPAGAVRGPNYVVKRGATPVLSADQARQLLDSIDVTELSGLRGRALIGVTVYSFARVSAAAALRIRPEISNSSADAEKLGAGEAAAGRAGGGLPSRDRDPPPRNQRGSQAVTCAVVQSTSKS